MLIDEVDLTFSGGHGGPGKVSFGKKAKSGPDGGNGGKGGDFYISVTSDLTALNQFSKKKELSAENGLPGASNKMYGSNGKDLEIRLPLGTTLIDKATGQELEINDINQRILICKGGLGGRGNFEFRSPRNTTPTYAQPGLPGEEKHFTVLLKFIADFGLIGLPNAGKSSLLNELTNANATIGDYPFTTLEPNLGVFETKVIADIPGLIEGASEGRGLGIKFLKHIEKVKLLLHCIASDSENVEKDYQVIMNELQKFSPDLAKKKQIILLTKSDLVSKDQIKEKTAILKTHKHKSYPISIHDWDSLQKLLKLL